MPSHYLCQCWNIVNCTLGHKFQWNFHQNATISIEENAFEYDVWKMVAILSQLQCVKCTELSWYPHYFPRLERLQRLAEKVHRDCRSCEDHLNDIDKRIKEVTYYQKYWHKTWKISTWGYCCGVWFFRYSQKWFIVSYIYVGCLKVKNWACFWSNSEFPKISSRHIYMHLQHWCSVLTN